MAGPPHVFEQLRDGRGAELATLDTHFGQVQACGPRKQLARVGIAWAWRLRECVEAGYVTLTPARRDDDEPMIDWAKRLSEAGEEVYVLTRDNFDKHKQNGRITHAWFERHVISYQWVAGGRQGLLLNKPQGVALPGL